MTGDEFRSLALSLTGTVEVPHFDRRAFKARRIFASLAPDELSANILITPDEQWHYVGLWPDLYAPLNNKWGERGWTCARLEPARPQDILPALRSAFLNGGGKANG